ncbi:restriction endonuclease [uncultured Cardiobacterium sp.]|uniref:restriction endonuclease n=1 Tax=uncultured Cardiobacterium sp. TaxID=417619 RepID=UPI00262D4662|nr:restriction endonuclease [uncultured Cardiobacterium sp.]
MTIPKYDELLHPIIQWAADKPAWRITDLIGPLAKAFHLGEAEIAQPYQSGHPRPIFRDRISWAVSLLYRTGLLDKASRGHYLLGEEGKKHIHKTAAALRTYAKNKDKNRQQQKNAKQEAAREIEEQTPQELLDAAYKSIRQEIYDDILDTILSKTPTAFEKLVIQLLQNMGYGGEIEEAARVTQQSRDGGIDGEIKEDVLGLGRIYIQAKRYKRDTTIGRPEIQTFVGALSGVRADKGVFMTTASYSKSAIDYVQGLHNLRIVLIDGMKLAEYIYDYNLGMQTEQIFSIKKMDTDFWDEWQNDNG